MYEVIKRRWGRSYPNLVYIYRFIYILYMVYIYLVYILLKKSFIIIHHIASFHSMSELLKKDAKKDILFLIFKFRSQYREN